MPKGITTYSKDIPGERSNYKLPVRFDMTDDTLGVTQFEDGKVTDRVLLSPKQVRALLSFATEKH